MKKAIFFALNDVKFLEFIENADIFEKFKEKLDIYCVTTLENADIFDDFEPKNIFKLRFLQENFEINESNVRNIVKLFNYHKSMYVLCNDYDLFFYDFERNIVSFLYDLPLETNQYVYVR